MKLSDYVAQYLRDYGVKHVFAITGGAVIHLVHSIANTEGITHICPQHEQSNAMAADAYARVTGKLGVAMATSGPGATNMITGICCSYFDSIPVLYITGQVTTNRLKGTLGIRQLGFQETDIVPICTPITKYATTILDKNRIKYELGKAIYEATTGRQGPVLLDIPDDIQRMEVNPEELESFILPEQIDRPFFDMERIINLISKAKKPLFVFGWGIRLAKAEKEAIKLIEKLQIPFTATWAALDIVPSHYPLFVGGFGTHGTVHGNKAIQNSDLMVSIGSRLDTKSTSSKWNSFVPNGIKVMVDIDPTELSKHLDNKNRFAHCDAKVFIKSLLDAKIETQDISEWVKKIEEYKKEFPICPIDYYREYKLNPYVFIKKLSRMLKESEIIVADTGCVIAWTMQAFDFKQNQRIIHDFNNTAMGYALPASIGAQFAASKQIICLIGDGSLQMTSNELTTIIKHNLPIKIFLFNNHGYSMVRQTEDQWLDSNHIASTDDDLSFPNFIKLAKAYGFKTYEIKYNHELEIKLSQILLEEGPIFCNLEIDPNHRIIPQIKFGQILGD